MKHTLLIPFALATALGLVIGCSSPEQDVTYQDVAHQDVAHQDVAHQDVAHQDVALEDTTTQDTGNDTSEEDTTDAYSSDITSVDTGSDVTNDDVHDDTSDADPAVCVGDPFSSCEARGNESNTFNSKGAAIYPPRQGTSAGCIHANEFVAYEGVFEERLCQNESADWFRFTLTGCEDITVLGEFRIELAHCPTSVMDVEVHFGSIQLDCANENFSCTVDDDGLVYRFRLAQSREIVPLYLGVISTESNGLFDYDVHYRVYR